MPARLVSWGRRVDLQQMGDSTRGEKSEESAVSAKGRRRGAQSRHLDRQRLPASGAPSV